MTITNNRKHRFNTEYFDNIDSENKAYFLGLLYADGNNITHNTTEGLSISLKEEDGYILESLKEQIKSDYPLIKRKSGDIMFYVYSHGFKKKLDSVGVFQRKTFKLDFPYFLSDNLIKHFIRGYFDGDGCIWNGKRKKMVVKDNKSKFGTRERIVHNAKFTFTGYTVFIQQLQQYLHQQINLPINKLNYRHKNNLNCATIEYSGRGNIGKLYKYMYEKSNIFMKRKKLKFEEILEKL